MTVLEVCTRWLLVPRGPFSPPALGEPSCPHVPGPRLGASSPSPETPAHVSAPGRERTRTDKQYDTAPVLREPGPERRGPDGPLPLPFLVRVESTGNGSKRRERNSSRFLLF